MKYQRIITIAMLGLCCNITSASNSQANEPLNNSIKATVPTQLPQELLAKFNNELVKLKAKAEAQKTPKQTERMMRFYWQYKNDFDAMSVNSQIDVLNIFATGDDQGSKLKGYRLIDKTVEYIVLLDGGFTKENVSGLRKYHNFLVKFNQSAMIILDAILDERLRALEEEGVRLKEKEVRLKEKAVRLKEESVRLREKLEKLIVLRKQMEIFAN